MITCRRRWSACTGTSSTLCGSSCSRCFISSHKAKRYMASTHGHTAAAHGDGHGGAHGDPNSPFHIHHAHVSTFVKTYLALLVLLGLTVAMYRVDISHMLHWVGFNLIIAMMIGIVKAYLVVRNFMNVKGSTKLTFLWAVLGFIW